MRQLSCDFDTNLIFDQPMLRGACSCVQPRQGIRCLYKHRMSQVQIEALAKIKVMSPT